MKARFLFLLWTIWWCTPFQVGAQIPIAERADGRITAEVDGRIRSCLSSQEKRNWCWAACIQAVMRFYDCPVSQRTIVRQVLGRSEDVAVTGQTIIEGINDWQVSGYTVVASEDMPIDMRRIVRAMQDNQPLIVGLDNRTSNHAMLLVGIEFTKDSTHEGKINPAKVMLIDPARTNSPFVSMGWGQFYRRVGLVLRLNVAK